MPKEEPVKEVQPNQHNNPQVLFAWKAPLRPYIHRTKQVVRFYLALAVLISLLVLFFGDYILLIPIATILFIFYVFTVTPPPEIENRVTQFGVETAGITLRFEELDHFYFSQRFGYEILTLVTRSPYPYFAHMVVPTDEIKKKLSLILSEHLVYQETPRKTATDKLVDWFSRLVPHEERNHTPLP